MLLRDAAAIENLRRVDTLIVDKTSTLTEGRPAFERAVAAPGFRETELLRLAASLDQGSEHPLTVAIVEAGRQQGLALETPTQFDSASGIEGVRALGLRNTTLMEEGGIEASVLGPQAEVLQAQGPSVIHLAVHGLLAGLLAVSDLVRATTADALASRARPACGCSWPPAPTWP